MADKVIFRALDELEKGSILGEVLRLVSISQQPLHYFEICYSALKNLDLSEENEIGSVEVGRALLFLCIGGLIESDGFQNTADEKSLSLGNPSFKPRGAIISWLSEHFEGVEP